MTSPLISLDGISLTWSFQCRFSWILTPTNFTDLAKYNVFCKAWVSLLYPKFYIRFWNIELLILQHSKLLICIKPERELHYVFIEFLLINIFCIYFLYISYIIFHIYLCLKGVMYWCIIRIVKKVIKVCICY